MTVPNQQLFSYAYLERLLADASSDGAALALTRQIAEWAQAPDLDRGQAWDLSSARGALGSAVLPTLDALGFAYRADPVPDLVGDGHVYTLYADQSHEAPLGTLYVAPPDADLDETHQGRHWMFLAVRAARKHDKRWALLTNGAHWRLLDAKHLTPYEVCLDLDLGTLRERRPFALGLARAVWAFLRRDAWLPDDDGQSALDAAEVASLQAAERAEQHLKGHLESVLGSLCRGFIDRDGRHTYTEADRRAIFESATIAIYRMLFALYAEARGLLPTDHPGYAEHSMRMLVNRAVALQQGLAPERVNRGLANPNKVAVYCNPGTTLWDGLKRLWGWIDRGNPQIGIDPYNGGLFSDARDDELGHDLSVLRTQTISDAHLSRALVDLATIPDSKARQPIDYRDLAVRHLGTLYEGILEHKLFIVEEPMLARSTDKGVRYLRAADETQKKTDLLLEVGEVYFAQAPDERKATGSYYTPEDVVHYIVQHTVRVGLDERYAAFAPELEGRPPEEKDAALAAFIERQALTFRVCDPAMGSGHFLVNTAHTITSFIVETLNAEEAEAAPLDCDPAHWRRRVVGSCLYGVDINPLAVELAKLSLWLTTVERGRPLSFLDHHLRCGNSLVGARLEDLPVTGLGLDKKRPKTKEVPEGQLSFLDLPGVRESMGQAASGALALEADPEQTPDDIHAKATRYQALRQELRRRYGPIADLAVARHLGLDLDDDTFRRLVRGYLDGDQGYVPRFAERLVARAREIALAYRAFHYQLEFPQVFFDAGFPKQAEDAGGFDLVVGNPPYGDILDKNTKRLVESTLSQQHNPDSRLTAPICANAYAPMMEKAVLSLNRLGAIGYVVPNSSVCSPQYLRVRQLVKSSFGLIHVANFSIRPQPLFPGVMQRIAIVLAQRVSVQDSRVFTTRYIRPTADSRPHLLDRLSYCDISDVAWRSADFIPKLGSEVDKLIYERLLDCKLTVRDLAEMCEGDWVVVYYHDSGESYWTKALSFQPLGLRVGRVVPAAGWNTVKIPRRFSSFTACLLNTSLFYWYWLATSDCRHLTKSVVERFPVPDPVVLDASRDTFTELEAQLMDCYRANTRAVEKRPGYASPEVMVRNCKTLIDLVDTKIGQAYGFQSEWVEYLCNYDAEHRVSE